MEIQIEDLVSSIKKDGVDAANAQAEKIIEDAKRKSAEIIEKAKQEAEAIKENAQKEIEVFKDSAKVSAEHAKRDAVLSFKDEVKAEFEKILEADVQKCVKDSTLAKLIIAAIGEEKPANYVAEVAEITDGLKSELKQQISDGMEIKVSSRARSGFRLAAKDGSGYFDCSDEEITKMLMPFFSELKI